MALTGVHHTSFTVSNLERSIEWFSTLLGAAPLVRKRSTEAYMGEMIGYPDCDIEWAYFPLPGGARLELIEYIEPKPARVDLETSNVGVAHLCLLVDDIQAEFERLSGIADFRSTAPVQKTAGPSRGGWGLYLRDPDGITIELMQPPPAGEVR
jgi:lactoylglutathione lyase